MSLKEIHYIYAILSNVVIWLNLIDKSKIKYLKKLYLNFIHMNAYVVIWLNLIDKSKIKVSKKTISKSYTYELHLCIIINSAYHLNQGPL